MPYVALPNFVCCCGLVEPGCCSGIGLDTGADLFGTFDVPDCACFDGLVITLSPIATGTFDCVATPLATWRWDGPAGGCYTGGLVGTAISFSVSIFTCALCGFDPSPTTCFVNIGATPDPSSTCTPFVQIFAIQVLQGFFATCDCPVGFTGVGTITVSE